eukprot:CAMPEP_0194762334 /NCGR_PEP_ID=MMETSP0323_2-20130528/15501_1 /TAXON_ID=2866 ORGANISM="Crypthecodinium cohnii, Strain Seligo" /NCGR_SAMPLE_ID=MMETSP0323_2 /ASSEMBLY_ACC=CAM_ASM_000346 /LENGTH=42 /DNA_ID= /DNA_START= /DNA_END= /DNA_ORIENTATION=
MCSGWTAHWDITSYDRAKSSLCAKSSWNSPRETLRGWICELA